MMFEFLSQFQAKLAIDFVPTCVAAGCGGLSLLFLIIGAIIVACGDNAAWCIPVALLFAVPAWLCLVCPDKWRQFHQPNPDGASSEEKKTFKKTPTGQKLDFVAATSLKLNDFVSECTTRFAGTPVQMTLFVVAFQIALLLVPIGLVGKSWTIVGVGALIGFGAYLLWNGMTQAKRRGVQKSPPEPREIATPEDEQTDDGLPEDKSDKALTPSPFEPEKSEK